MAVREARLEGDLNHRDHMNAGKLKLTVQTCYVDRSI